MSHPPRCLILETSGRTGHVALAEGGTVRSARRLEEARRHARDLAPAVGDLLAEQGWTPADIAAVLVSRGPGSYTGLRVGLMSARAFAYATGCALVAVDTFAVLARQAPPEADVVDVLADAQKDMIYVQRFRRSPQGEMAPATPLSIQGFADWTARRGDGAWLTGPGLARWEHLLPPEVPRVQAASRDPSPEALLAVALPRLLAGECDDLWTVEPLYLRPSAAEVQWEARRQAGSPGDQDARGPEPADPTTTEANP